MKKNYTIFTFAFLLNIFIQAQLPEFSTSVIQSAINNANPGDVIALPKGIYRGPGLVFTRSGNQDLPITLMAHPGDSVIIKGSVIITDFILIDSILNIYKKTGYTYYIGAYSSAYLDSLNSGGSTKKFDARDKARNQLFINGEYIPEVPRYIDLKENSFYIDKTNTTLYIRLANQANPNLKLVESSIRSFLLDTKGYSYLSIKNIYFKHCANLPQDQAMVRISGGTNNNIENIHCEYAAGAGFTIKGNNHIVKNSIFNHNGQLGIHATQLINCLIENCENSYNNYLEEKQFDRGWEAGGNKFTRTRNFILRGHLAHHNNGAGIWFDVDNQGPVIENCISYENLWGIHYEISYTAIIRNNICFNNRCLGDPDSSPVGIGIYISSSAGCKVYNNIAYGNETYGIQARGPIRDDGAGRQVFSHSTKFYNNIVAQNQATGNYTKSYDIGYGKNPNDTTTYNLTNSFLPVTPNKSDYNLFYLSRTNKEFFIGPGTSRPKTLTEWQTVSKQDSNSVWGNPQFIDPVNFNFHILANSPAINNGLSLPEVNFDFDGIARPQNLKYDIGAFEFQSIPTKINYPENTQKNYIIYPNPSTGKIYFNIHKNTIVEIYNIMGILIYKNILNPENAQIDLSGKTGLYIINLNKNEYSQKIILK